MSKPSVRLHLGYKEKWKLTGCSFFFSAEEEPVRLAAVDSAQELVKVNVCCPSRLDFLHLMLRLASLFHKMHV